METTKKTLNIPKKLIKDIEQFRQENYIATFTAAMIELVRRGLNK